MPNAPDPNDVPLTNTYRPPSPSLIKRALRIVEDAKEVSHPDTGSWQEMACLQALSDWQETYRISVHIEDLDVPEGYRLACYVLFDEPHLELWSTEEGEDKPIAVLPPRASQETVEAAIAGWEAGLNRGLRSGMHEILDTVAYVMNAA